MTKEDLDNTKMRASPVDSMRDLSVAEVRRSLAFIRKNWDEQSLSKHKRPFYLCDPLNVVSATPQSIESFALNFVLAHHTRRLSGTSKAEVRLACPSA